MNLFKSIPQKAKSIQVHHVRTNHWILSMTNNGCVEVFDSVYDDLSADTRTQLSTVYKNFASTDVLDVEVISCQKQLEWFGRLRTLHDYLGLRISQWT